VTHTQEKIMTTTFDRTDFQMAWQELHLTPGEDVTIEDLENEARGAWQAAGCPEPKGFLLRWINT
jgi:hypothetical protein